MMKMNKCLYEDARHIVEALYVKPICLLPSTKVQDC